MTRKFNELPLSKDVLKALNKMSYIDMTPVQDKTIELILEGRDIIVRAKTGSGKTAAFGVPMVERLAVDGNAPKALILTPTRELAIQVDQEISKISKYKDFTTTAVYGQHNIDVEIKALSKGATVITGTPGRVYDHLERRTLFTDEIEYLVIDEADRMLDMGFIDQVMNIIAYLPKKRITMLFSATMPFEVQTIAWQYMNDPVTIEIESQTKTVDIIKQGYYRVEPYEKRKQLHRLLKLKKPNSAMVFCNTRREVDRVAEFLQSRGYYAEPLHGALSQARRLKTINKFKRQRFNILVATDVAARGIHVDELELVINYDLPDEKDAYIHRIGRTGRAGNKGSAFSLVTSNDIMTLYEIEEHIGTLIEEWPLPVVHHTRHAHKKGKHVQVAKRTKVHNRKSDLKSKHISRKVYTGKKDSAQQPIASSVKQRAENNKHYYKQYEHHQVDEIINAYKSNKNSKKRSGWRKLIHRMKRLFH